MVLKLIQFLIRNLLQNTYQCSKEIRANCLFTLWMALAKADPRLPIRERALLECLELQKHWRSMLHSSIVTPYAMYAILLRFDDLLIFLD